MSYLYRSALIRSAVFVGLSAILICVCQYNLTHFRSVPYRCWLFIRAVVHLAHETSAS